MRAAVAVAVVACMKSRSLTAHRSDCVAAPNATPYPTICTHSYCSTTCCYPACTLQSMAKPSATAAPKQAEPPSSNSEDEEDEDKSELPSNKSEDRGNWSIRNFGDTPSKDGNGGDASDDDGGGLFSTRVGSNEKHDGGLFGGGDTTTTTASSASKAEDGTSGGLFDFDNSDKQEGQATPNDATPVCARARMHERACVRVFFARGW